MVPRVAYRGQITEREIIEMAARHLPAHSVPVLVVFEHDDLVKNAAGKVLKDQLKERMGKIWTQRLASKL